MARLTFRYFRPVRTNVYVGCVMSRRCPRRRSKNFAQNLARVSQRRPRSTYGHTVAPGASVYSASKHAVEGLTKSAALEAAGTGVRVNVIAPGPIETAILDRFTKTEERKAGLASTVPLKRVGRPEEIAQAIVLVSSDKTSFITGATSSFISRSATLVLFISSLLLTSFVLSADSWSVGIAAVLIALKDRGSGAIPAAHGRALIPTSFSSVASRLLLSRSRHRHHPDLLLRRIRRSIIREILANAPAVGSKSIDNWRVGRQR